MKRHFGRLILTLATVLVVVFVMAALTTPAGSAEPTVITDKLAEPVGPAQCWEAPDIPEDYENQKIEAALYASGYFRSDIPLDGDTQALLRAACEETGVPYELALSVIWKETKYQNITGDDGDSQGYMQVQERWHKERMARLGVTDLTDPSGNFRVGCDYLAELLDKYPLEEALTAYNSGSPGESDYAKEVIEYLGTLNAAGKE